MVTFNFLVHSCCFVFWNLNFGAINPAANVRFDFYALYDNVLVFENGTCYSKR